VGPTVVRVPEECSCIVGVEIVAKGFALVDGALCDHRRSVHVGLALQEYPVPMQCRFLSRHCVLHVYDNSVPQTYLKARNKFPT
jgi:hypothetical protein